MNKKRWTKSLKYATLPVEGDEMPTLGEKIRTLRKAKGMTLDDLAVKIDAQRSYIWGIENGRIQSPSAENLTRIAKILNTTINTLLDDINSEEEEKKEILYRNYRQLAEADQKKIDEIIELWKK